MMSDYMSNTEQSAEIASGSQPYSSRASPDSADPANGTEATPQSNAWPPLEMTDFGLSNWPNSNNRLRDASSTAWEILPKTTAKVTPEKAIETSSNQKHAQCSQTLTNSEDRNLLLREYTPRKAPPTPSSRSTDQQKTPTENNQLRFLL